MAHTPYPAAIHACSCKLIQKSRYSVCPSVSSPAGASVEPYTPALPVAAPASEAGNYGLDHKIVGRDADARALVLAAWLDDNDDTAQGGSLFGVP
jgi:hypothetical protein